MHTTRYQLNREYGLKRHEEWANLIPGIRRYMDYPHIASIACPKPMLFINGKTDHLFPPISVSDAFNTDLGGFDVPVEVSHEEVQKAANAAQPKMTEIMREMIRRS